MWRLEWSLPAETAAIPIPRQQQIQSGMVITSMMQIQHMIILITITAIRAPNDRLAERGDNKKLARHKEIDQVMWYVNSLPSRWALTQVWVLAAVLVYDSSNAINRKYIYLRVGLPVVYLLHCTVTSLLWEHELEEMPFDGQVWQYARQFWLAVQSTFSNHIGELSLPGLKWRINVIKLNQKHNITSYI